jgi:acyl carrier protein
LRFGPDAKRTKYKAPRSSFSGATMPLPTEVIEFLKSNAASNGLASLQANEDLFTSGTLDSFALVDFVTVLEEHCGIRVPDAEVIPANFRTIEAIDQYVSDRRN